jgi:hypothetical protein
VSGWQKSVREFTDRHWVLTAGIVLMWMVLCPKGVLAAQLTLLIVAFGGWLDERKARRSKAEG